MKRTCLISSALALTVVAPTVASAEPGILYIPTEAVTLTPFNEGACGSGVHSALGCDNVEAATDVEPYADVDALTTAMTEALADYDVWVTNTRPVEYLPYVMLLPSDEESPKSQSFTCTGAGINCGSRNRNDIIVTRGTTMNCMDPEQTHAALYAFGRASGLEGVVNPDDYMNYVPDYTMPPMGFQDECSDRANQLGFDDKGNQVEQQLECTSLDHFECPDGMNGEPGQNSYQDLLMYYGPRTEDGDPPVIMNVVPADGTVLMTNPETGVATLEIDAEIMDADLAVGARWTITSDALPEEMFPGNMLTICTNDICNVNWDDVAPAKATDSDWASPVDLNFPPGVYAITFEAADYHGNVAEMVSFSVTIEGEPPGGSSGGSSGNVDDTGNDDNQPPLDSGFESTTGGDDDDTGSGANDDSSGGGCSCRTTETPGGLVLMLLGFVGLGAMRRRW